MKKLFTPEKISIVCSLTALSFFAFRSYAQLNVTTTNNVGIGIAAPVSLLHAATSTTATGVTTFEQASGDADACDLNFRKTRGTVASPTVITSGDQLGTVNFNGYSGAGGYVTGAAIKAISEGTIATTRVPAHLSFWTGTDAAPTVLTERMRIDKSGNVGIGTASPSGILDIETSAAGSTGIDINNTATDGDPRIAFQLSGTSLFTMGVDDSDADKFKIGTTGVKTNTRLTITFSGMVGIGTTTPGYLLEVNDVINSKGGKLYAARYLSDYTTRRNWGLITESNQQGDFTICESLDFDEEPSEPRLSILRGGNVGIGVINPGYKLEINGTANCTSNTWTSDSVKKQNIQPLSLHGISIIKQLRPVSFEWKDPIDPGMLGTAMGFIAQDIEAILPTMITAKQDSIGNLTKSVKFLELLPLIVKGIQEQQTIIDSILSFPTAKKAAPHYDSLMHEIENLKTLVNQCCTAPNQNSTGDNGKGNIQVEIANSNHAILYQNEPNPFSNQTIIRYFIPENITGAFVVFHDEFGREVNKVKITEKGFGKIEASTEHLASGMYSYSIIVDGKTIDTKKMLKSN